MAAGPANTAVVEIRGGRVHVEIAERWPMPRDRIAVQAERAFWFNCSPADARRLAGAIVQACDAAARRAPAAETADV